MHPCERIFEVVEKAIIKSVLNVRMSRLCSEVASFWWTKANEMQLAVSHHHLHAIDTPAWNFSIGISDQNILIEQSLFSNRTIIYTLNGKPLV